MMDITQIEEGEWIADGVLASLASESRLGGSTSSPPPIAGSSSVQEAEEASLPLSSTESHGALHPPGNPLLSRSHQGLPLLQRRVQPDRASSVPVAGRKAGTSNQGILANSGVTATTNSGTPVISKPSGDNLVLGISRPMMLPQRPVSSQYAADGGRSASLVNNPGPARRPAQSGRSWPQETSNTPVKGPSSSQTRVQSMRVMGDDRSKAIQPIPSQPRAMQTLPPVKVEKAENIRLTSGVRNELGSPAFTDLSHRDLQKWPCRRCCFVHKGSDCERHCIGCGSKHRHEHDDRCPFKDKVRGDEYSPLRRAAMSPQEEPTGPKAVDPGVSATMQLSIECQRQGFNPEFKYFQGVEDGNFKASLSIKDVVITSGESSFATQKDARDALAPEGLEILRKMGQGLSPVGYKTANAFQTFRSPVLNRNVLSERGSSSRLQNIPTHQPGQQDTVSDNHGPITDLIKSVQSSQQWGNSLASNLASATSNTMDNMVLSEQLAAKRSVTIELPSNIDSSTIRAAVERAVAANPQTNISLHFPANVSVEIARAYGSAISAIATSHNRSRSRSPEREVSQVFRVRSRDRDRDRDRQHDRDRRDHRDQDQDRGRYHQPAGPSVWPPRGMIDTYRPPLQLEPRRRAEDARFRMSPPLPLEPRRRAEDARSRMSSPLPLEPRRRAEDARSRKSPPLESRHCRPYDRKGYGPRDRPARN